MVVVRGWLTPKVGAVLRRALEAACYEARRAPASDGCAEARAADAASRAGEELTIAQRQADAIGVVAAPAGGLDKGTAGDRYQGCCESTQRRWLGGEILDVGRRTRTFHRALAARDRQCRSPGCGNRRTAAHHIEHWADGGRTALDNLVLLCRPPRRSRKSLLQSDLAVIRLPCFPGCTPLSERESTGLWNPVVDEFGTSMGEPPGARARRRQRSSVARTSHTRRSYGYRHTERRVRVGRRICLRASPSLLFRPPFGIPSTSVFHRTIQRRPYPPVRARPRPLS